MDPPTQNQWLAIVEEIYIMEKMTFRIRLQEEQGEQKWTKWTLYKDSNIDGHNDPGEED